MKKLTLTLQVLVAVAALPTLAFMEMNHGAKKQEFNKKQTMEKVQTKAGTAALNAGAACVNLRSTNVLLNLVVSN
jgi:hypothetical protein